MFKGLFDILSSCYINKKYSYTTVGFTTIPAATAQSVKFRSEKVITITFLFLETFPQTFPYRKIPNFFTPLSKWCYTVFYPSTLLNKLQLLYLVVFLLNQCLVCSLFRNKNKLYIRVDH